jgi:PIN domain nuclease of toxin-antitoxin system
MSVAATDAHALIWHVLGHHRRLGPHARQVFSRADAGQATLYVPVVALVEIGEAVYRGTIRFDVGFSHWVERLLAAGRYPIIDLTPAIVLEAESLRGIRERADRLIAATAVHLDCPLITNDPQIAGSRAVKTIW